MVKRKAREIELEDSREPRRRSSRRITSKERTSSPPVAIASSDSTPQASPPAKKEKKAVANRPIKGPSTTVKKSQSEEEEAINEGAAVTRDADEAEKRENVTSKKGLKASKSSKASKPPQTAKTNGISEETSKEVDPTPPAGRQYWLMKAEPESRLENGRDIKFSIDDLRAKTKPEPWDGIRAYPARNNLRAMKKGDLAFFYHSSCKVPAIVGIMEIVREHEPDLSAHDPSAAYHDPKSTAENPRWSVVHVEFRQKLETPITLKELRGWQGGVYEKGEKAEKGENPLKDMQMLKLTRLSVSRVSEGEWEFLVGEMGRRGDVVDL